MRFQEQVLVYYLFKEVKWLVIFIFNFQEYRRKGRKEGKKGGMKEGMKEKEKVKERKCIFIEISEIFLKQN